MKLIFFKLTIVSLIFIFNSIAKSATDGVLGNPSTGTTDIQIFIGSAAKIYGLSDIDFGSVTAPFSDVSNNIPFCVYTSTSAYTINANGTNDNSGNFRLSNGTDFVIYQAWWNDRKTIAGSVQLSPSVTLISQAGDNALSATCSTENANLKIMITGVELTGKTSGLYSDTLTLVIAPE